MTVHLVNLTNPMMMKGPIRELYAIGPQQVTVRLPEVAEPAKCDCWSAKLIRRCMMLVMCCV